jgi:hypothetical protein
MSTLSGACVLCVLIQAASFRFDRFDPKSVSLAVSKVRRIDLDSDFKPSVVNRGHTVGSIPHSTRPSVYLFQLRRSQSPRRAATNVRLIAKRG